MLANLTYSPKVGVYSSVVPARESSTSGGIVLETEAIRPQRTQLTCRLAPTSYICVERLCEMNSCWSVTTRFVGLVQLASPVLLLRKRYKTQKTLLHHPVATFTSSSGLANDGRIGDRELRLRRRAARPGSLLGGWRANRDNTSYSSRVAATFCFVFTTTLHGGTPALMRIRKLPHMVSSVSCNGSPLQYPAYGLRGLSFPHASFRRWSVEHQLGFVSPSLEAQHMCRVFMLLPPFSRRRSSVPFAVDQSLHCSGCWPSFRERDRDTPPFALKLWRTL